ncbi:MAG TPA: redoxin domain-containing protein [Nitrospirae bacterium]|nr:redoxin domain-containing protein [Nitrospirota bacterium]
MAHHIHKSIPILLLLFFIASITSCTNKEESARKLYNKALSLQQMGDDEEAAKIYMDIVDKYPETETAVEINKMLTMVSMPYTTSKLKEKYKNMAAVGESAPDFELMDDSGKKWKLSDLKGKVVFINVWSTWNPSSKSELQSIEAFSQQMKGEPFQMLRVLFRDDLDNLKKYKKTNSISTPILLDRALKVCDLFGVTGVPETFIIDKKGIIREKIVGPRDWNQPENIELVKNLLQ